MNTNNPVDITFQDMRTDEVLDVKWYHVPRAGDYIEISEPSQMVGKVQNVTWLEDSVVVRVK